MTKPEVVPNDKLIVVTGGAGYVGSTVCRELIAAGFRVRVMDCLMYGGKSIVGLVNHPRFEFVKGDLRSMADLDKALSGEVDAVVHLAAIVGDVPCQLDTRQAIDVNYKGTMALAEKARSCGIQRFVFASTCSNYGVADTARPADEDRILNPVSLYAETKIDCERGLIELSDATFSPIVFRFATAYGVSGRTRFDLLVNSFSYEALSKGIIVVYAANTWRPYVHVLDMANIIIAGLRAPLDRVDGQIFNAGSNVQNYPKYEVANMISLIIPGTKVSNLENVDDPRTYRVDFSKIEKGLGFIASKTVEHGIREIVHVFESGFLSASDYEANSLSKNSREQI